MEKDTIEKAKMWIELLRKSVAPGLEQILIHSILEQILQAFDEVQKYINILEMRCKTDCSDR